MRFIQTIGAGGALYHEAGEVIHPYQGWLCPTS